MGAILRELASWARFTLRDSLPEEIWSGILDRVGPYGALGEVLNRWAEADRKPLVLLIEIGSLVAGCSSFHRYWLRPATVADGFTMYSAPFSASARQPSALSISAC